MEQQKALNDFFNAISGDPRIGVSHVSLYCALLQSIDEEKFLSPIMVRSTEVMKIAKILSLGTYHKCIKDLNDFGYIKYLPCFNHRKKSKVFLTVKNNFNK